MEDMLAISELTSKDIERQYLEGFRKSHFMFPWDTCNNGLYFHVIITH